MNIKFLLREIRFFKSIADDFCCIVGLKQQYAGKNVVLKQHNLVDFII